jgi:hypothetical protein
MGAIRFKRGITKLACQFRTATPEGQRAFSSYQQLRGTSIIISESTLRAPLLAVSPIGQNREDAAAAQRPAVAKIVTADAYNFAPA